MDEAVRRLRPDQSLEAAGYIRVSLERQATGYSPAVQRDAIKRLAAEQGYALTMIEEDHERGSKVTRVGYQKIIEAVRAGSIHAVIVFMFDRWGRDGAEWLTRAREFERLGVPIISVQEGKDEGGLIRFMRAGMAEEYSRQLGKRVRPSRERGARSGTHMGPTPLGYNRVYPPLTDPRHRPPGRLEPDPATAWVVQELFRRYASGDWSGRTLANWMNSDPRVPQRSAVRGGEGFWTANSVRGIIANPVYCGMVRYNRRPIGLYDRAAPGSVFIVDGQHEAIIDTETFDRVQERVAIASTRPSYNRQRHALLGSGLFVCSGCGGPMTPSRTTPSITQYKCGRHRRGSLCAESGYMSTHAHGALLREIVRLRGAPWAPQVVEYLGGDARQKEAAAVQHGLTEERERLRRHTRLMSMMADDPTPEQIASFREVSAEISGRIRSLEAQLSDLDHKAAQIPNLKDLHTRLTQTEIRDVVSALEAQGDQEGLRTLIQELVAHAHIVERLPALHARWLRAEVVWKPDVQLLLEHGLLAMDPAPTTPPEKHK